MSIHDKHPPSAIGAFEFVQKYQHPITSYHIRTLFNVLTKNVHLTVINCTNDTASEAEGKEKVTKLFINTLDSYGRASEYFTWAERWPERDVLLERWHIITRHQIQNSRTYTVLAVCTLTDRSNPTEREIKEIHLEVHPGNTLPGTFLRAYFYPMKSASPLSTL